MILRHKGIEYQLSPLFFIITSALLLFDKSGYMSFSLLFSAVHEIGHILMMFILGKPPKAIRIMFYGLEIKTSVFSKKEMIMIALSGPLVNILISIIFIVLSMFFDDVGFAVLINLIIALFNLLPVSTLDGGDVLLSALSLKFDYYTSKKIAKNISLFFSIIILIFGVVLVFYNNFSIAFVGIYLFMCNLIKSD